MNSELRARTDRSTLVAFLATAPRVLFLRGQVGAWRIVVGDGVLLPTKPHGVFFYTLTALHGLHLLGGIVALIWARFQRSSLAVGALSWHFIGEEVWLYLWCRHTCREHVTTSSRQATWHPRVRGPSR